MALAKIQFVISPFFSVTLEKSVTTYSLVKLRLSRLIAVCLFVIVKQGSTRARFGINARLARRPSEHRFAFSNERGKFGKILSILLLGSHFTMIYKVSRDTLYTKDPKDSHTSASKGPINETFSILSFSHLKTGQPYREGEHTVPTLSIEFTNTLEYIHSDFAKIFSSWIVVQRLPLLFSLHVFRRLETRNRKEPRHEGRGDPRRADQLVHLLRG